MPRNSLFVDILAFHYQYFLRLQRIFELPGVCLLFLEQKLHKSITRLVRHS